MSRSNKQTSMEDRYLDKLDFLNKWYQERVSFLSTFKLPGVSLSDLEKEIQDLKNGSGTSSGDSSAAGSVPGNGNEEKTWNFFAQNGFSAAAISGIMGNLKQESSINPKSIQGDFDGAGYGIAQWDKRKAGNGRWDSLVKWAKGKGQDEWAIETQLQYLLDDLSRGTTKSILNSRFGGLDGLKKISDYKQACDAFEQSFERAGKPMMDNRYKYAKAYFDKWGKNGPSSGTTAKGDAKKIIDVAESWLKKPNVYWFGGGRTAADIAAGKFDCSSWVRYIFDQCGYTICAPGGNTDSIISNSSLKTIKTSDLQPGDLVFFDTYKQYGHITIYLGNNKAIGTQGDTGKGGVGYVDMTNSYWKPRISNQHRRVL